MVGYFSNRTCHAEQLVDGYQPVGHNHRSFENDGNSINGKNNRKETPWVYRLRSTHQRILSMVSQKGERMITWTDLSDWGILPDQLIRLGIRMLDKKRLKDESHRNLGNQDQALSELIERMRNSPIALHPEKPNEQH